MLICPVAPTVLCVPWKRSCLPSSHTGFPQEPEGGKMKQNYQFFNCILFLPQHTVNPFSVNSWTCCPLPTPPTLSHGAGSMTQADKGKLWRAQGLGRVRGLEGKIPTPPSRGCRPVSCPPPHWFLSSHSPMGGLFRPGWAQCSRAPVGWACPAGHSRMREGEGEKRNNLGTARSRGWEEISEVSEH